MNTTEQPFDNKHMRSVSIFKLKQAREALELMLRSEKTPSVQASARDTMEQISQCLFMIPNPDPECN